jgi:hypothetical protein
MEETVDLSDVVQVSGLLFALAGMLAMGLALTVPMIAASVSNVRLTLLALFVNFVGVASRSASG